MHLRQKEKMFVNYRNILTVRFLIFSLKASEKFPLLVPLVWINFVPFAVFSPLLLLASCTRSSLLIDTYTILNYCNTYVISYYWRKNTRYKLKSINVQLYFCYIPFIKSERVKFIVFIQWILFSLTKPSSHSKTFNEKNKNNYTILY